jgi:hypothetical protein
VGAPPGRPGAGTDGTEARAGGVSRTVTTYDTTAATITTGMTVIPSVPRKRVVSSTAVIGSRSIATVIAPIPMATAGTSGNPGRWDRPIPPAAPRNIAGNVGPPRKPASEAV